LGNERRDKMAIEKIGEELCIGCEIYINDCPIDVISIPEKTSKPLQK